MLQCPWTREDLLAATPVVFSYRWLVRFQDVDAAGIVFFARILGTCHEAYMRLLLARAGGLREALEQKTWAMPLVHAEGDFLRPMRFGDAVDVEVVKIQATPRKLFVGYRMRQATDGTPTAVAQTAHVYVNLQQFQRIDMPPEARLLLEPYLLSTEAL